MLFKININDKTEMLLLSLKNNFIPFDITKKVVIIWKIINF